MTRKKSFRTVAFALVGCRGHNSVTTSFMTPEVSAVAFARLSNLHGRILPRPALEQPTRTTLSVSRRGLTSSRGDFNVTLRPATPNDLDLVLKWDEQDHMQDEDKFGDSEYNDWNWDFELNREANVEWRHILIAEYYETPKSKVPIGVIQVLDPYREESQYWGTGKDGRDPDYQQEFCQPNLRAIDIWIGEPDYLGRGLGTQMMQLALRDHCFADPDVNAVLVDPMAAHKEAIRFYQKKCGFEPVGLRQFGPDRCLVHRLERQSWEKLGGVHCQSNEAIWK
jgi:aminoglycoside 6'-N-acetyltransferase